MLFWAGVLVVLVVVGVALSWGLRGYDDREHEPGSQRLRPPARIVPRRPSPDVSDAASRSIRRPHRDDGDGVSRF